MKKTTPLILFIFLLSNLSGQIMCIHCYQQNDSVYAGGVNLIQNGGFEDTTNLGTGFNGFFCPISHFYSTNITNWICTGGGTSTYAVIFNQTESFIPEGISAAYFGNGWAKACSSAANDISCVNNVLCTIPGIPIGYPISDSLYGDSTGVSLEQTVTGMITGSTYILEFWAGGENSNSNYPISGVFAVDVGFGNTFLRDIPTGDSTGIGTRYLVAFQASSNHTIKFTNWGHICLTCTELVLDDIKLYEWILPTSACSGAGINELTENTINIYPNPANDKLTIEVENLQGFKNLGGLVKIYNVWGEEINVKLKIENGKCEVDLKNYSPGIYFVEIKSGREVMRKRFVKQ